MAIVYQWYQQSVYIETGRQLKAAARDLASE